ncbi:MAG: hypothetical protein AB7O45_01680 [Alphaproteobacteria bacterium]
MTARPLSPEQFRQRLDALGAAVPEERIAALYEGYRDVMALAARLRRDFGYGDEPAHVFPPEGER